MWPHCDQEFYFEAATRNPSTHTLWYKLGIANEPNRPFRKSFATAFERWSIRDFFREYDHNKASFCWHILHRGRAEYVGYGWNKVTESTLRWSHSYTTAYPHDDWSLHLDPTKCKLTNILCGSAKLREQILFLICSTSLTFTNRLESTKFIACQRIGHHGRRRTQWIKNELEHSWIYNRVLPMF